MTNKQQPVTKPWIVTCVAVAACLTAGLAAGQTLDEQYDFYLRDNCSNLGFEREPVNQFLLPGQAGPNLTAYCSGVPSDVPPGVTVVTNSVGGAAGVAAGRDRGAGEDAALRRRKDQLRDGEGTAETAEVSVFSLGGLGVFLSLDYGRERQTVTQFEGGRDSDRVGAILGADYRLGVAGVIGLAMSYAELDGNFTGGGGFEQDNQGVLLYVSWFPFAGAFVDGSVGIESGDLNTRRIVGRRNVITSPTGVTVVFDPPLTPVASGTDSSAQLLALRGGYDFLFRDVVVGPRLALARRNTTLDSFAELGATPMTLRFDEQRERSLQSSVGVEGSKTFGLTNGVVTVQLGIDWLHEFDDDQRALTAIFAEDLRPDARQLRFLNQAPDRNWYSFRAATVGVFTRGLSAFASIESTFGHDYLDRYGASFGFRQEF